MLHPPIQVVDENDQPIRGASKHEVWEQGLWHRIVRIMAEDTEGRILLQKRSAHVDIAPNCWDHSAAGHVDLGEDYLTAAKRELSEELGIHDAELEEMARYQSSLVIDQRKLNRFSALYRVRLDSNAHLQPDQHEVSETRWFTLAEVQQLIADHPDQVTDGLRQVIARYY